MVEAARSDAVDEGQKPITATRSGGGRVLIAVYGIFALAACSRAGVQLGTKFHEAPIAYLLSAFSGLVYVAATVFLASRSARAHALAVAACTIELVGVITIGIASFIVPKDFPDQTVWSGFGSGYGYIPLVLPMVGLWWLRRTSSGAAATPGTPGPSAA